MCIINFETVIKLNPFSIKNKRTIQADDMKSHLKMFIHLYCLKNCAYKKLIYLNIYMYHGIENIHVIRE